MTVQTQPIKLRRTSVAGAIPAASEFTLNTFVINDADSILYFLDGSGAVQGLPILPGLSAPEIVIASAATTDLGSKASDSLAISGSTTITSFGTKKNQFKFLRFTGSPTITYNVNTLNIVGGVDISIVAGTTAIAVSDANGNWRLGSIQKPDNLPYNIDALRTALSAVRFDAAQTLTAAQKTQFLSNVGAQALLGYTPVQQGGGTNQGVNKIYIGWSGSDLLAQVDTTNLGKVFTDSNASGSIDGSTGYSIQRFPSGAIIILGSSVVTTNASGVGSISIGVTSSSGNWVVMPTNGDSGQTSNYPVIVSATTTGFTFFMPSTPNTTVRINWVAVARWR